MVNTYEYRPCLNLLRQRPLSFKNQKHLKLEESSRRSDFVVKTVLLSRTASENIVCYDDAATYHNDENRDIP